MGRVPRSRFAAPIVIVLACHPVVEATPSTQRPIERLDDHFNPPPPQGPFDARVIKTEASKNGTEFTVGIPDPGVVTKEWTGVFISDGNPIAGTEFTLTSVTKTLVKARLEVTRLPSEYVRLIPPLR